MAKCLEQMFHTAWLTLTKYYILQIAQQWIWACNPFWIHHVILQSPRFMGIREFVFLGQDFALKQQTGDGRRNGNGIWVAFVISGLEKNESEAWHSRALIFLVRYKWEVFSLHSEIVFKKKWAMLFYLECLWYVLYCLIKICLKNIFHCIFLISFKKYIFLIMKSKLERIFILFYTSFYVI